MIFIAGYKRHPTYLDSILIDILYKEPLILKSFHAMAKQKPFDLPSKQHTKQTTDKQQINTHKAHSPLDQQVRDIYLKSRERNSSPCTACMG
ncbi:hypothetical protein C8N47_104173 [Mangrovibacterium marinum]|uniref:Uncharacterized protein n=1 Tax=Mangrovibacterium marinum TaxID=1639118 RepID=A0A2T5C4A0_9BACT|nr:hypothetical protein C8N47_104173 [Mangrovibacterium marinum]